MDAFSAGISLALYEVNIIKAAILFTAITCFNSALGFILGGKLKALPRKKLEISAGIILIALGVLALF
jgi:putative Mn2+ efflux pump MntP